MSARFTPGPWKANGYLIDIAWDKGSVARVYEWGDRTKHTVNLIAAAPDMYEALKRLLNSIENTEAEHGITLDSGDLCRAAIAKAEGEQ